MCKTTTESKVDDGEQRRRAVLEAAREEGTRLPAVTSSWSNEELENFVKRDRAVRAAEAQGLLLPPGSESWARRDLEAFVRTGGAVAPRDAAAKKRRQGRSPEAVSAAMQVGTRAARLSACIDAIVASTNGSSREWASRFLGDASAARALLNLVDIRDDASTDDARELMNALAGTALWALISNAEAWPQGFPEEETVQIMQRLVQTSTTWQAKAAGAAALGSMVVLPGFLTPDNFWTTANILAVLPQLEEMLRACPLPGPREAAAACACNVLGARSAGLEEEDPLLEKGEWCLDRLETSLITRVSMSEPRAGLEAHGGTRGERCAEALALTALVRLRGNARDVLRLLRAERDKLNRRRHKREAAMPAAKQHRVLMWHLAEEGKEGTTEESTEKQDAIEDELDAALRALVI